VWAVDSRQNVFVREGITDTVPCGMQWTCVSGINYLCTVILIEEGI